MSARGLAPAAEGPEREQVLPQVAPREGDAGEAVAGRLPAPRQECGPEQPVPQRELGGEVEVVGVGVGRVVPAVGLGAVDQPLEASRPHVHVGVDPEPPHRRDHALDERHLGGGAEEHHRRELDRLVDQDLERVRAQPGEPVDARVRVVGLVDPPQHRRGVLEAVEPVDVEVVRHHEERHLRRQRPGRDEPQPREAARPVHPQDERRDDEAHQVALDEGVADEVGPEALAEEALPVVGEAPLQDPEQERPADDHGGGDDLPGQRQAVAAKAVFTLRSFSIWGSSPA